MIFGGLSNAVYRVSLHGLRAELEGVAKHPPVRRARRRAGARRELSILSDNIVLKSCFVLISCSGLHTVVNQHEEISRDRKNSKVIGC